FAASAMDKKNVVSLYPNPATDYIQVKIQNSTLEEPTVILYNVLGNEVEVTLREEEEGIYNIDIANIPAGYYFLAIRDEKSYFRETYKFVKR
ncbi:MAG: T9SS type A sorting domain-containing protein, partial [Cyclobacteriaceae bacterium]